MSELLINFSAWAWQKRCQGHAARSQGLVRACKPQPGMKIIDATAGWGKDALVLASLGADVTLIERDPDMAKALMNAIHAYSPIQPQQFGKLNCVVGNAIDFLTDLQPQNYPHVIYLDPMHPPRQKSAAVKKEMQWLQQKLGYDEDASTLLNLACTRALQRVVVKWPRRLAPLSGTPSGSILGKAVRFDIYAVKR